MTKTVDMGPAPVEAHRRAAKANYNVECAASLLFYFVVLKFCLLIVLLLKVVLYFSSFCLSIKQHNWMKLRTTYEKFLLTI